MRLNQLVKGVAETVHPDITGDEYFNDPTENVRMGNFEFNARTFSGALGDPDARGLQIRAYDPKRLKSGLSIGSADFIVKSDSKGRQWLESDDTEVDEKYRNQGVAAMMYAFAKSLGNDIKDSPYKSKAGADMWAKWGKDARHLSEQAVVTRIDSKEIKDFDKDLKAYKHTDDWHQSGIDTGDDSYWTKNKLKVKTTKGLFAGDPHRTALYATGNAHETRYVEFVQDGQPIVYFDKKDLPAMRNRKTYLTQFKADNFKELPTGEWFSENPGKPIRQEPITDPFKYIASQGWVIRITDDLDKIFRQVKKMHQAGKISQYGAEGMS